MLRIENDSVGDNNNNDALELMPLCSSTLCSETEKEVSDGKKHCFNFDSCYDDEGENDNNKVVFDLYSIFASSSEAEDDEEAF